MRGTIYCYNFSNSDIDVRLTIEKFIYFKVTGLYSAFIVKFILLEARFTRLWLDDHENWKRGIEKNCFRARILHTSIRNEQIRVSIMRRDELYFEDDGSFRFPFPCSSWRDLALNPRSLNPWKVRRQTSDNILEEISVLVDSLPYAPLLLTIGGRLAKVESIREPTTISTYTMLAGQAREQCVCTTSRFLRRLLLNGCGPLPVCVPL